MTRWLAEAAAHFATVYGEQAGPVFVVLANELGEHIRFTVPPEPTGDLPPIAEAVLQALREARGPMAPKVLARKAGYRYNSNFRATMTNLVRRNLAVRGPDGYTLAEST